YPEPAGAAAKADGLRRLEKRRAHGRQRGLDRSLERGRIPGGDGKLGRRDRRSQSRDVAESRVESITRSPEERGGGHGRRRGEGLFRGGQRVPVGPGRSAASERRGSGDR